MKLGGAELTKLLEKYIPC